jgi:hypothetical protein
MNLDGMEVLSLLGVRPEQKTKADPSLQLLPRKREVTKT